MTHDINLFISKLLTKQTVDLTLYNSPDFCSSLKLYVLEKIKFLLLDILSSHLPHEHVGSHDPFYLSNNIHKVDHNGLNILDYCILAGLDDIGSIFAKLGCINTIDTESLLKKLNDYFPEEIDRNIMISEINKAVININIEKQQYKLNPLDKMHLFGGKESPTLWEKIKYVMINFPYSQHKFAIVIILFGISCIIAAPFTAGLSTILLLSLGFPAILAGLGNLQSSIATLSNYQQIEENSRITHETEMLRIMHKEVCHQIKVQSSYVKSKTKVSMHIHNTQQQNTTSNNLLYLSNKNYGKAKHHVKKEKIKLNPSKGT